MNEEFREKKKRRFVPNKKKKRVYYKISDHAVKRFGQRISKNNGNKRSEIKGILENGNVVLEGNNGCVINKDRVYAIIRDDVVKTIYTEVMYMERKKKIKEKIEQE